MGASVVAAYVSDEVRATEAYHIVFGTAVMPLLRYVDAETAHQLGIQMAHMSPVDNDEDDERLRVRIDRWGAEFSNPIGLAAGFDKQGEAVEPLLKAGFGFVEVGTVTPQPQGGNPKPRMFRLVEDDAVINRYGFNSDGLDKVAKRVLTFRKNRHAALNAAAVSAADSKSMADASAVPCPPRPAAGGAIPRPLNKSVSNTPLPASVRRVSSGMVGLNVGKNKSTEVAAVDYHAGIAAFTPLADYLVVNISSPNTPGLRELQRRAELRELLLVAIKARAEAAKAASGTAAEWKGPPLLVKIAPDVTDEQLADIVEESIACGIDGIIVSNTTIARPDSLRSPHKAELGGLSGAPLFQASTEVLKKAYVLADGRMPLVGAGGVSSGEELYAKIRAGASLVQLYTAMAYQGPSIVQRIKRELIELLDRDGFINVQQAVGVDAVAGSHIVDRV